MIFYGFFFYGFSNLVRKNLANIPKNSLFHFWRMKKIIIIIKYISKIEKNEKINLILVKNNIKNEKFVFDLKKVQNFL